jgi:hypothetical protein
MHENPEERNRDREKREKRKTKSRAIGKYVFLKSNGSG